MSAAAAPHRCSVLIIEDEPELQSMLRVALGADGYDVAVVGNGRDALKHLRSTPTTCLIVLDLLLPVMDGRRFRSVQLRDRSLAWIPIVVVAGGGEAGREARKLGARKFTRKPIDIDQLRSVVSRVSCSESRRRRDQRTATPAPPDMRV